MTLEEINQWCREQGIKTLVLDNEQLAQLLGLSVGALYNRRRVGNAPKPIGKGKLLYTRQAIVDWVNENENQNQGGKEESGIYAKTYPGTRSPTPGEKKARRHDLLQEIRRNARASLDNNGGTRREARR